METSADDIGGLNVSNQKYLKVRIIRTYQLTKAATGVITIRGGVTSHAAVIMRGMGKSAVTGASNMSIRTVPGAPAASTTTNSSTAKTIVVVYLSQRWLLYMKLTWALESCDGVGRGTTVWYHCCVSKRRCCNDRWLQRKNLLWRSPDCDRWLRTFLLVRNLFYLT